MILACLAPAALGLSLDRLAFLPAYLFGLGDGPISVFAGLRGLIGYFLVHDGAAHLFANVLALALFGAALETRLGARRTTALFFAASIFAALTEGALTADRVAALAGASGGASGVMGALAVLAPGLLLRFRLYPWGPRAGLPVLWLLGLDVAANLFTGALSLTTHDAFADTVAWRAHLAGFGFGLAMGLYWRNQFHAWLAPMEISLTMGFAAAFGWRVNMLTAVIWVAAAVALVRLDG